MIFLDQGSNQCPLHWWQRFLSTYHQEVPECNDIIENIPLRWLLFWIYIYFSILKIALTILLESSLLLNLHYLFINIYCYFCPLIAGIFISVFFFCFFVWGVKLRVFIPNLDILEGFSPLSTFVFFWDNDLVPRIMLKDLKGVLLGSLPWISRWKDHKTCTFQRKPLAIWIQRENFHRKLLHLPWTTIKYVPVAKSSENTLNNPNTSLGGSTWCVLSLASDS